MSQPAPSAGSTRALTVLFALLVLSSVWLLTRSWQASLLDRYEFRQLQTALSTWWIAHEGWQLDYLTPLFGPPWSVPMEFPTYQVMVATLHNLTGMPLEQSGRSVGILMLLACLPALYDLLAFAGLHPSRRLIVLAIVITSPVYLFYARTFMIETTALCFSVWFLALLRRSLGQPRWCWIVLTTLFASLAGLTKITTYLVFGLPAVALVWASLRRPAVSRRHTMIAAVLPALLSLGLTWWWIRHGDTVKDSNPFTGFLAARELHAWNFGPFSLRLNWSFWLKLQEIVVGYNLAEGALALALLCAPFAPARCRWMALVCLLGFLSGPLVFANLYHIHDYYYAANSLLLLAAAGLLLAAAWDDPRLPRGANWLAFALVLFFQFSAFYRGYYSHHRHPAPPPPPLAAVIREAVPAEGVVLVYGADWNPLLPYYSERRAVMVPGERENETEVLEQVLGRLAPRQIAAMVIHGDKLRGRTDFVRERAARFGFGTQPVARQGLDELYLPTGLGEAALARIALRAVPPVELLTRPAKDDFSAALHETQLPAAARALFTPLPLIVRTLYGINPGELAGQPVLNSHAPCEFLFQTAPAARQLRVIAGLPDSAFSPGKEAVTDGIMLEIFSVGGDGAKQLLHHRRLHPAQVPGDRGPQTITVDLPPAFAGALLLRLGTGPAGNPTNDWAYLAAVEIR